MLVTMLHAQKTAELYDVYVQDWPGEIQFYQDLVSEIECNRKSILEVACGTGRVLLQLAKQVGNATGLDISPSYLEIARRKSANSSNIRFIQADMRSFQLSCKFPLVIIPGHAFQNLVNIDDQLASLKSIGNHLANDGELVLHVNHDPLDWLSEKSREGEDRNPSESRIVHPYTKNIFNKTEQWKYNPANQTAHRADYWIETTQKGIMIDEWSDGPYAFHVFFPFEMEHLLKRAGYIVKQVYGDFYRNSLSNNSPEMVWIAQKLI